MEFDRRYRDRGVRGTAVHPGAIQTELGRHMAAGALQALIDRINESNAATGDPPFRWKSIPEGAATSLWAGVVASADQVGDHYCEDCHVADVITSSRGPGLLATAAGGSTVEPPNVQQQLRRGVRDYAVNPERARALWAKSEEMVGERF